MTTKTLAQRDRDDIANGRNPLTGRRRKARTLQDIVDHPFVESTHVEWDGAFSASDGRELPGRWVYLKTAYISPDNECGTIHESSVKACCELLNDARLCTLEELEAKGFTTTEAQAILALANHH